MPYIHDDPRNCKAAAKLLAELLPAARRSAEKIAGQGFEPASNLGSNTMKWLRLSDCAGVHVYRGDKGGWFADLYFDNVPAGVCRIIGTPVGMPKATRDGALDDAVGMLASFVADERKPAPDPDQAAGMFVFDDVVMQIPSAAIEHMRTALPARPDIEYVRSRLGQLRDEFGDGEKLTVETVQALSPDRQLRLRTVFVLAVMAGLLRWPELEEAPAPPVG